MPPLRMKIYDKDERTILANPSVSKEAVHEEELMSSNFVKLTWYDRKRQILPVGAYVVPFADGLRYILLDPYEPKAENHKKYKYEPQFQHPIMWLGKLPFIHLEGDITSWETATKKLDWTYYGAPGTIAVQLVNYINWLSRVLPDFGAIFTEGWTAHVDEDLPPVVSLSFSSVDVLSGAAEIADKSGCEYHFDFEQKFFYLGKVSYLRTEREPYVMKSGDNVGVASVSSSKEGYYNCFHVSGGTKNMTQETPSGMVQSVNRLTLDETDYPDSIIYTSEDGRIISKDQFDAAGNNMLVKQLVFDDVYPKQELYIYKLRERKCWLFKENADGTKSRIEGTATDGYLDPTDNKYYKYYSKWYLRLAYKLNNTWADYVLTEDKQIKDTIPTINFQINTANGAESSPLAGQEFDLVSYSEFQPQREYDPEEDIEDGVQPEYGDYRIEFVDGDIILPTTRQQGVCPRANAASEALGEPSEKNNIITLGNVIVDDVYKKKAQEELLSEALTEVERLRSDLNSYSVNSDPIDFKNNRPNLYIGQKVIYDDGGDLGTSYGDTSYRLETRIQKLVTRLDHPEIVTITMCNQKRKGTVSTLKEQVQSIIMGGLGSGEGGGYSEAQLNQIIKNYGARYFISKMNDDTAQGVIIFLKGLWIKAKELFGINENGDARLNNMTLSGVATINDIKSSNYTGGGMADTGFLLTSNDNTGSSKLTVDNLYVRKKATFEELEVKKITAIAGNQIYSSAANVILRTDYFDGDGNEMGYSITKVPWLLKKVPFLLRHRFFGRLRKTRIFIESDDIARIRKVRCYFLAKDEDREVYNLWKVQEFRDGQPIDGTGNDFARCQTMNITNSHRPTYLRGMETKAGNVYWWRRLCGVSSEPVSLPDGREYHYFDVEFNYAEEERLRRQGKRCAWCDLSSGDIPAAGDNVVQFGNDMNTDRMNLIAVEVNGDDAPAHKWYRGIYTFDLTKCWWGGNPRKEMISAASGVEFYASHYKLKTDYGVAKIPMDRPEVNWSDIAMQRDDYSPYELVRKLYYYDSVTHNGSRWLCFASDGQHWVRPQVWDDPTYAVQDANGNYRHNGNRISDTDYYQLTIEQKEQCIRVSDYTTAEPSSLSGDWKQIVYKGDNSVRIDLDNENDVMLYSSSKGLVSGNVVSNAYLYDGIKDVSTSATWSINAIGCTATITNRVITVTAMSASVGSVTVSAVYNGFTYTAILSLKKILDADKYELIVTPNSIAYNNTTDTPATSVLSIQVFKTACDGTRSLSAPPSGYNVYAGSTKLAASSTGTYSYTTDNSAVNSVVIKISTSTSSTDCLDSETIPVNKTANGAKGDDGYTPRKGVDYFDGKNGKDGWMVSADPANVIITQNISNSSSFTSSTVSFSAKKGNVSASLVSVGTPSSSTFNVSKSGNNVLVSSPKTHDNQYYNQGSFSVQMIFRDPDSSSNIAFTMTVLCYANLLGSWEETVVGDTKTEIARSDLFDLDASGNIVASNNLATYIRSSTENTAKLNSITTTSSGETHIKDSEFSQTVTSIKQWVRDELGTTGIYIEGSTGADPHTITLQANKVKFTSSDGSVTDKVAINPNGTLYASDGGTIGGFSIGTSSIGKETSISGGYGYTYITNDGQLSVYTNPSTTYSQRGKALRVNGGAEIFGDTERGVAILCNNNSVDIAGNNLFLNANANNNASCTIGKRTNTLSINAGTTTFNEEVKFNLNGKINSDVEVTGVASLGGNIRTGTSLSLPGSVSNPPKVGTFYFCKSMSGDMTVTIPYGFKLLKPGDNGERTGSVNIGERSDIIVYMGNYKWVEFWCG